MFVAHAAWLRDHAAAQPGRLVIWAEDSTLPSPLPRRGRAPRVRRHPYAASPETLADLLGPIAARAAYSTVTLHLPTRAGAPMESPELVRDVIGETVSEVESRPWQVPALLVSPDVALAMRGEIPSIQLAGASIVHIACLADFAVDLVARGRVLPGVLPEGPYAVWRPVLTGPDATWARTLAMSLPPPLAAAERSDRLGVWAAALDALVDAAARAALGATRLDRARVGNRAVRAWLGTLTGADRRFQADLTEVHALATALATWQQDAVARPVRACFRLAEPAAEEDAWEVAFALQASDEPGLVVAADAVWRSRGKLRALARHVDSQSAGDIARRAGQGQPPLSRPGRSPSHRPADGIDAGHRRRAPVPQRRRSGAYHRGPRGAAAGLVVSALVSAGAAADGSYAAAAGPSRRGWRWLWLRGDR